MTTLVVIAKAPVPGMAKTRLAPEFGRVHAARVAAAALLDTLDVVRATPADHRVVAFTGDLARAECADQVRDALADFTVIQQRGDSFGARLANAHQDAAQIGDAPVVLIGMDTPQVTPKLLTAAAAATVPGVATLGPASDGGWWMLGLADPAAAEGLVDVPMSTTRTGALTASALVAAGLTVHTAPELADVDTPADARKVSKLCRPSARFPRAVADTGRS